MVDQIRGKVKFAFLLLLLLFMGRSQVAKFGCKRRNQKRTKRAVVRSRKPTFFIGRHTTAAGREARMTEVEPQRPEAGSTTDPIAPTEPAVGMRAGR